MSQKCPGCERRLANVQSNVPAASVKAFSGIALQIVVSDDAAKTCRFNNGLPIWHAAIGTCQKPMAAITRTKQFRRQTC
jgi:hypothetical protein